MCGGMEWRPGRQEAGCGARAHVKTQARTNTPSKRKRPAAAAAPGTPCTEQSSAEAPPTRDPATVGGQLPGLQVQEGSQLLGHHRTAAGGNVPPNLQHGGWQTRVHEPGWHDRQATAVQDRTGLAPSSAETPQTVCMHAGLQLNAPPGCPTRHPHAPPASASCRSLRWGPRRQTPS